MVNRASLLILALFSVVTTVVLSGCSQSDDSLQRYSLNGTVTLNGKAVKRGSISLEPDSTSGNHGPGTSALIDEGSFRIQKQHGHVGGKQIVYLSPPNFESGVKPDPELSFDTMKMSVVLPADDSRFEFDFKSTDSLNKKK